MKQKQFIGKLIGRFIKVTNAKNKTLVNIQGIVTDETKNTIKVKTDKKQITLIKSHIKIENGNKS